MKTAMQELFDEMTSINWHLYSYEDKIKIINVHFEKEKEQIIEAIDYYKKQPYNAFDDEYVHTGEDYYNQTFNPNKQNFCYSCGGDKGEHALFCQFCRLEH